MEEDYKPNQVFSKSPSLELVGRILKREEKIHWSHLPLTMD